jgi:monofunctional biosynthetic peptidoglycan transglycosylase
MEKSMRPKKKNKKSKIPFGGGASTISQQTAKNVFLWQGSSFDKYIRKIPEFYFTFLIEKLWGKQRILEVYLNVIETGPGCFGVEAAAQHYFHKSSKNLTRAEAAMIVAGFPNPKKFTANPMTTRVNWRYPQILREMNNIETDEDIIQLLKSN